MVNNSAHSGKYRYPHHKDRKDGGEILAPALLVSYVYLEQFLKSRHKYHFRDWVLDSGAFSAHNSGTEIKLQEYIDCCKELMETDGTLTEIFALDVIGDWKASLRNVEEMWRQGVPAIPAFHPLYEPMSVAVGLAKDYPKIAIGGIVGIGIKQKMHLVGQTFARVWPKRIHGFGISSKQMVLGFPFHSVDATNWEMRPCAFGRWASFGKMSVRGSKQNLRSEVEYYLKLEREARSRWSKEMRLVEEEDGCDIRLAVVPHTKRQTSSFSKE